MNTNTALNQTWAAHIEKWRLSGLSAKVFCEQEGLVYHQFGYWRQKFSGTDVTSIGSKLVPVTMTTESRHISTGLEIILPNGMVIRGIDESNASIVAGLVASL